MAGFMTFGGKSKFQIITSPEMDKERMLFFLEKQLKYEWVKNVTREKIPCFFQAFSPSTEAVSYFWALAGGAFYTWLLKKKSSLWRTVNRTRGSLYFI